MPVRKDPAANQMWRSPQNISVPCYGQLLRAVMCRCLSFALGLLFALHLSPRLLSQEQKANSALNTLVSVLAQSDDPQFQYDILKGMSEGLKGRRGVTMPAGWEDLAKKLTRSPNTHFDS